VVEALKTSSQPEYVEEVLSGPRTPIPGLAGEEGEGGNGNGNGGALGPADAEADPLYDEAVKIVTQERKPSISYVQRRLKIGYNRAARLIEAMEAAGLVGPLQPNGAREVLAPPPPED
jgi:S-DNA-T family DNA segregation ATPase FtsK/SpoIIIE